jgi:hypothetical protein
MGAAGESLQGQNPSSGTPFKLQELVTNEAKGLHIYRQGKIATFVDEIYQDWIMGYMAKEITKDTAFLSELSADEFQQIYDTVITNRADQWMVEKTLNGEVWTPEELEAKKQELQKELSASGSKQFIKWMKDDFKDAPMKVRTNIAGKQKNLAGLTDKVVNVLRQFIATPEIRQDPTMLRLLNVILESSGLSPIMFNPVMLQAPQAQPQQGGGGTEALQALAEQPQMQPNA